MILQNMELINCSEPLDRVKNAKKNDDCESWSMLEIPGMWVSFVTFIFSTMSNGFLSVTLEAFVLRQVCFI